MFIVRRQKINVSKLLYFFLNVTTILSPFCNYFSFIHLLDLETRCKRVYTSVRLRKGLDSNCRITVAHVDLSENICRDEW